MASKTVPMSLVIEKMIEEVCALGPNLLTRYSNITMTVDKLALQRALERGASKACPPQFEFAKE